MSDIIKLRDVLEQFDPRIQEAVKEHADCEYIRKGLATDVSDLSPGERAAVQWVSTKDVDRDDEVIVPEGANLKEFQKAPVVLWSHNYGLPAIGSAMWSKVKKGVGVMAKTGFADSEMGRELWTLVRDGHIRTVSAGFIPHERVTPDDKGWPDLCNRLKNMWGSFKSRGVRAIIPKWTLLEYSIVNVPANPNALTIAVAKGMSLSNDMYGYLDIGESVTDLQAGPDEHVAKMRDPSEFEDDSFRIIPKDANGKQVNIVMGQLKGETAMTQQAVRYSKEYWTASAAKAHATANDADEFTPAQHTKRIVIPIGPKPIEKKRIKTIIAVERFGASHQSL